MTNENNTDETVEGVEQNVASVAPSDSAPAEPVAGAPVESEKESPVSPAASSDDDQDDDDVISFSEEKPEPVDPDAEIRDEDLASDEDFFDDDEDEDARPIEEMLEDDGESAGEPSEDGELEMRWYILKVQVNRENSICDALQRRVKIEGKERFFGDILVPTEDVREFTKSGKQRVVKRKLYPGYVVVRMAINDDTWFLVRDTPGIGDFTGAAGKPVPLNKEEIDRIVAASRPQEVEDDVESPLKTSIRFKVGDRVRVKEGYFQNYEGEVSNVDERNGRVTVMINIFGRQNPVEIDHWQVEDV